MRTMQFSRGQPTRSRTRFGPQHALALLDGQRQLERRRRVGLDQRAVGRSRTGSSSTTSSAVIGKVPFDGCAYGQSLAEQLELRHVALGEVPAARVDLEDLHAVARRAGRSRAAPSSARRSGPTSQTRAVICGYSPSIRSRAVMVGEPDQGEPAGRRGRGLVGGRAWVALGADRLARAATGERVGLQRGLRCCRPPSRRSAPVRPASPHDARVLRGPARGPERARVACRAVARPASRR